MKPIINHKFRARLELATYRLLHIAICRSTAELPEPLLPTQEYDLALKYVVNNKLAHTSVLDAAKDRARFFLTLPVYPTNLISV